MENFVILIRLQATLLIYIAIGVYCRKKGIVSNASESELVSLAIDVILPCMIFNSMTTELKSIDWMKAAAALIISSATCAFAWFLGSIIYKNASKETKPSLKIGTLITNAAFMGMALVSNIFGSEGVFYASIYMTVSRAFLWSVGIGFFSKTAKGNALKSVLLNPNTIAMMLALVCVITKVHIPEFVGSAIKNVGNASSMLSMVVVGTMVAKLNMDDIGNSKAVVFSAIRLCVIPILVYLILSMLHIDKVLRGVIVLLTSLPAPSMTPMLALRYGADEKFATIILMQSTALSLITVPLLTLMYC